MRKLRPFISPVALLCLVLAGCAPGLAPSQDTSHLDYPATETVAGFSTPSPTQDLEAYPPYPALETTTGQTLIVEAETITPGMYPYPAPESQASPVPSLTLGPTEIGIPTGEGGYPDPDSIQRPTFTPYPSPTLRPGPTETPVPMLEPAGDASGTLYFLARRSDGALFLHSLEMDAAGNVNGEPISISSDLDVRGFSIYPSPDGKQMAIVDYFSDVIASGSLINLATGKSTRFDQFLYLSIFFNWFPDNRQILMRENDGTLRLADPVSGENTRLATPIFGRVDAAAASPDGKQVIYAFRKPNSSQSEVWIVNADGRDAHMLLEISAPVTNMAWSPNGKQIAFHGDGWTLIEVDGSNLRQLGTLGLAQCKEMPPSWSPDSRWLAIDISGSSEGFCTPWDESVFKDTNILLFDIESGKVQPILPDGSPGNLDLAWSPDGKQIAFVSNRSGNPEIWIINVDGRNLHQVTSLGEFIRFPLWGKVTHR